MEQLPKIMTTWFQRAQYSTWLWARSSSSHWSSSSPQEAPPGLDIDHQGSSPFHLNIDIMKKIIITINITRILVIIFDLQSSCPSSTAPSSWPSPSRSTPSPPCWRSRWGYTDYQNWTDERRSGGKKQSTFTFSEVQTKWQNQFSPVDISFPKNPCPGTIGSKLVQTLISVEETCSLTPNTSIGAWSAKICPTGNFLLSGLDIKYKSIPSNVSRIFVEGSKKIAFLDTFGSHHGSLYGHFNPKNSKNWQFSHQLPFRPFWSYRGVGSPKQAWLC